MDAKTLRELKERENVTACDCDSLTSWACRDVKLPFPALAALQMLTSDFLETSHLHLSPDVAKDE